MIQTTANASEIRYLMVGFSSGLLGVLDRLVEPASVLIIDEPEIIASRRVEERVAPFRCVAGIQAAPIHDESIATDFDFAVPRPSGIRAVFAAIDYGVVWAAAIAELWKLPGASLHAARLFRNKHSLRRTLEGAAVRQPDWAIVPRVEDAREFYAQHPEGMVLKPSNLQGSIGVRVITHADAVDEAWLATSASREDGYRASSATAAESLAEAFVAGREVSVEALVDEGDIVFVNVTEKSVQAGPFPVELGHLLPAQLSAEHEIGLCRALESLIVGTGVRTAVLHAEFILDAHSPTLIECAARLPGDGIVDLISAAWGFDFVRSWLCLMSGTPEPIPSRVERNAGISFASLAINEDEVPRLSARLRELPALTDLHITPGDGVAITSSGDRNIVITSISDDRQIVIDSLSAASHAVESWSRNRK